MESVSLSGMTAGSSGHVSVVRGEPLVAAEGAGWVKEVPMVVKFYGPRRKSPWGDRGWAWITREDGYPGLGDHFYVRVELNGFDRNVCMRFLFPPHVSM